MSDDLDLKDAIAVLVSIQERTKLCRDAVERSAKAQGVSAAFLLNAADRELEALSVAIAALLLARGKVDDAGEPPKNPPVKPPAKPWPKGAQVEPLRPVRSPASEISF